MPVSTVTYTANGSTNQFSITFPYIDATHVLVSVNGSSASFSFHNSTTAQLSSTPTSGQTVVVFRQTPSSALVDFTDGSTLFESDLDLANTQARFLSEEARDRADSAITTVTANKANIDTVAGISGNVTTVAGISANVTTVAGANSNVATVVGNLTNINTVAGINSNISSVAGNASNITAVANDATDIGVVAGKATEITALGTSSNVSNMGTLAASGVVGNIASVAGISSDVTAVAGKASLITSDFVSDLNTVAVTDVINDINTLATSDVVSDLNQLATSDFVSDLNQLATTTNVNNISTVAGIAANVTSVAGVASNVTTVAGISSAVSTVAADGSDIGTVAGISSAVSTVSSNNANVSAVAGAVSNVNTVAGAITNVNTVAGKNSEIGLLGNSDTVADLALLATAAIVQDMGLLANSTTIGNIAQLGTAAVVEDMGLLGTSANVTAMSNVSGSLSNVNTVATNLSGITAFSAVYSSGGTDPSSNLNEGDLFYNTSSDNLKVYNGSAWVAGVTAGSGFLPLAGGQLSGNLTMAGNQTIDGRDLSVDGTKLDGVEASADVTDTANVGASLTNFTTGSDATSTDFIPVYDVSAGAWEKHTIANAALQGPQGTQGPAGATGAAGSDGSNGSNGSNGSQGAQGPQGNAGSNGSNGSTGSTGSRGPTGNTGATGGFSTNSNAQVNSLGVGVSANGGSGQIRATNNITAYYSDERLKTFSGTIPDALAKITMLNGYYFTENDHAKSFGFNNDRVQVGVSAQEVQAVLPEVVTDAPFSGEYLTVWYDKLVPLLIEAIKELKAEVEELKSGSTN